jgi:hypothetical protein
MTQVQLMNISKTLVVNAVSQAILQATGLPDRFRTMAGGNVLLESVYNGAGFAVADDLTGVLIAGDLMASKIYNGNWLRLVDESLYNSFVQYGFSASDLDLQIAQTVVSISPFSPEINTNISRAVIAVLTNTLRDYIEMNLAPTNMLFDRLVHPTKLFIME